MAMNEAEIYFNTNSSEIVEIFGISEQCHKCKLQYLGTVSSSFNTLKVNINSIWPYIFQFRLRSDHQRSKSMTEAYREGGIYNISIQEYNHHIVSLSKRITNDPENQYMPLIVLLAVFFGIMFLWPILKCIRRQIRWLKGEETNYFMEMEEWEQKVDSLGRDNTINENSNNQNRKRPKKRRLRSIDTFRGMTIILMIFVNYGGGGYYFFEHAVWNGLTVADLVFPWFIFIMGISIALSFKSFQKSSKTYKQAFGDIVIRSIKMFFLGIMLNMGKNLTALRIPGVLQRFGLCYLFVATLNLFTSPSQKFLIKLNAKAWFKPFKDMIPFWFQWLVMFGVISAHSFLTFALKVPGCPSGYLGPGGLSEGGRYFNCTGGSAGYIDRFLLGKQHLYGYPTCKEMYKTIQHFDPEGILGILPSIVLTFLGLQVGKILMLYPTHKSRIIRWLIWAFLTGGIGFGLTSASLNDGLIPINKNLWSLSYILVTSATGFVMMSLCYLLSDVRKLWDGSPFYFCGMNAISLYLGHMLIAFNFYWHEDPQTHYSATVRASVGTLIWIMWAYYLYRKQLFFTV